MVDKVSEIANGDKILAALKAYQTYQTATNQDKLSQASPDAKLPDPQIFFKEATKAVIVILPERHDSTDPKVQSGAAGVATAVLAIPAVKIAVEEPTAYNGTLISNVGWEKAVITKPPTQPLFEFGPFAQGSISHQLYVKQGTGTVRYAAEDMPSATPRNNPAVNRIMAEKLIANTSKAGEISVFPVGPNHLSRAHDEATLSAHLGDAGWEFIMDHT